MGGLVAVREPVPMRASLVGSRARALPSIWAVVLPVRVALPYLLRARFAFFVLRRDEQFCT